MEKVRNLSIEDYHNGEGISASQLKKAIKSTSHFFVEKQEEGKKEHFEMGHAFELLLTEPEKWDDEVFVYDESKRPEADKTFAAKVNKEWKANIFEENKDKIILLKENEEVILEMIKSCKANPVVMQSVNDSLIQQSYFWKDEETGLLLKTRPDVVKYRNEHSVVINDIKTTMDASPEEFAKSFSNFHYGIQAATQVDGVESALGVKVEYYTYTVVEKVAPFNAQVYYLNEDDLEFYRQLYKKLLKRIKRAMEDKEYISLGYSEDAKESGRVIELEIPVWHRKQLEKKFDL